MEKVGSLVAFKKIIFSAIAVLRLRGVWIEKKMSP